MDKTSRARTVISQMVARDQGIRWSPPAGRLAQEVETAPTRSRTIVICKTKWSLRSTVEVTSLLWMEITAVPIPIWTTSIRSQKYNIWKIWLGKANLKSKVLSHRISMAQWPTVHQPTITAATEAASSSSRDQKVRAQKQVMASNRS